MKAIEGSISCPQCGSSHKAKCFYIYSNGYYCFSCNYSKSSDRSFSFREIQTTNPNYPELSEASSDISKFDISILKWLAQYHITPDLIRDHSIMCCGDGSVIYQNIHEGKVVGYQRRWPLGERRIITKGPKSPSFFAKEKTDTIIIVEDYLSAVRCSRTTNTCCLWGTKLDWETVKKIVDEYTNIIIWLDNDCNKSVNSGQIAAEKLINTFKSVILYKHRRRYEIEQTVCNVATEKDPKCYVDSELKSIIDGALYANTPK